MRCFGQTQPTPEAVVVAPTSGCLEMGLPTPRFWLSRPPRLGLCRALASEPLAVACGEAALGGSLRRGALRFPSGPQGCQRRGGAPGPPPTQPSYLPMLVLAKV